MTISKKEYRKRWADEGLRKWKDIKGIMHRQFLRDMPETADAEQTWSWLRSSNSEVQPEVLICVAQEQALIIRLNYIKELSVKS